MAASVLPALKKRTAPPRNEFHDMKLWTLKEFDKLFETGILTERYELLEGVIVEKMGQNAPHRVILHAIANWLMEIYGLKYVIIQSPIDIPVDKKRVSRPEPDITVLTQSQTEFSKLNPRPEDVHLVVEVADSSLDDDLDRKARIYSQAGIAEYWVADVKARQIWVHRVPSANGYQEITILFETQAISTLEKSQVKILVSEFLPQD